MKYHRLFIILPALDKNNDEFVKTTNNVLYELNKGNVIMNINIFVSIRSTPYCISQKNVVSLHDSIIFLILKQEYEV